MKTLIINGSPRKGGDSMTLVNEMIKYLDGDIKIIHTYYDSISPCVDCRYCWKNDGCSINDGMQEVYRLLDEADNVILSSPLYFSELTGRLLDFASRLQCFYAKKYIRKETDFKLKKKKAVLVISGGGDGSPKQAIASADIILKLINGELIGTVMTLNTDNVPAKNDVKALNEAHELAVKLNELNNEEW